MDFLFPSQKGPINDQVTELEGSIHINHLFPRKGGGGHGSSGGRGSGSTGRGGGSSSSSSSSGSRGGSSSSAKSHGASSQFTSSPGATSFSISKSSGTTASPYSDGGGSRVTLGTDTSFPGRQAGGGSRDDVYGTSRFGSGYPYGGDGIYIDYRPMPYRFYPTPPANNYYGGQVYVNINGTERPGGPIVSAIIQPSWNRSSVTYRLLGDNASVIAVFDALVANCSVTNTSTAITPYWLTQGSWPVAEQIIQYYRASTFALGLDGYNNTAALPSNMPLSNTSAPIPLSDDTPLPSNLNRTFLACVNTTVGASVPLIDNPKRHGLTQAQKGGIIAGSICGFFVFFFLACFLFGCYEDHRIKKRKHEAVKRSVSSNPTNDKPLNNTLLNFFAHFTPPCMANVSIRKIFSRLRAELATKTVEPTKGSKGSKWLSRIPCAHRLGYQTIKSKKNLQDEESAASDDLKIDHDEKSDSPATPRAHSPSAL